MITVMLGWAGAPVASITVTSDMTRIFCWTFCCARAPDKPNEIKSRAKVKVVFISVFIFLLVRLRHLLDVAERGVVFDLAGSTIQKTRLKLHNHEYLFRHVIFAADANARRRREPETRVVGRVTQDNYGTEA